MKVLKSQAYLMALLGFPPGINSTGELGLFTFRAPVNSLKLRVLFCKCQILMAKDTIRKLSPQIRARVMPIYGQNNSTRGLSHNKLGKTRQLPFQTCNLLRRVIWNARNNGSLFAAHRVCAASKCNNCWVPTNQQPPCWVMKAFMVPAVAQWKAEMR